MTASSASTGPCECPWLGWGHVAGTGVSVIHTKFRCALCTRPALSTVGPKEHSTCSSGQKIRPVPPSQRPREIMKEEVSPHPQSRRHQAAGSPDRSHSCPGMLGCRAPRVTWPADHLLHASSSLHIASDPQHGAKALHGAVILGVRQGPLHVFRNAGPLPTSHTKEAPGSLKT